VRALAGQYIGLCRTIAILAPILAATAKNAFPRTGDTYMKGLGLVSLLEGRACPSVSESVTLCSRRIIKQHRRIDEGFRVAYSAHKLTTFALCYCAT